MHWARRPWVFWATASLVVLGVAAIICRDPASPASAPTVAAAPVEEAAAPAEAPFPRPVEPRVAPKPQEAGPGETSAREAALLGAEDWIAEVQTHSPDWRTATVKIGPPQSEWVLAISLTWDAQAGYYDVVGEEEVPYP